MKITSHLLSIFLILPFSAYAHGQEILFTFFLPIVPAILFLIILNYIRLQSTSKKILLAVYFLSLFLSFFIISNWSYFKNQETINLVVTIVAPIATLIAFFAVKGREKETKRKHVRNFLETDIK